MECEGTGVTDKGIFYIFNSFVNLSLLFTMKVNYNRVHTNKYSKG